MYKHACEIRQQMDLSNGLKKGIKQHRFRPYSIGLMVNACYSNQ